MIYDSLEQREDIVNRELDKVIPLLPHDRENWHEEALCRKMVNQIPVKPTLRDEDGNVLWEDTKALEEVRKTADMWFLDSKSNSTARKVGHDPLEATAADLCFQCPVRQACLKYACDTEQPYGTWGGMPITILKSNDHNYPVLAELKNPFDTDDTDSPFHRANIRHIGVGTKQKNRKETA